MSTDFFERQSDAHKSTIWLVVMFTLAVVGIVGAVFTVGLATQVYRYPDPLDAMSEDPRLFSIPLLASAITLLLIGGGTLFKVFELRRGGGTLVAERLGGRRLYPDSEDATERRLLNVVEEMALASGTPVPPVFLLEEDGINAFAAGYSPSDAVLGVTRGCATLLSRDELQGVIAHEFSHILNGDMRMSIRLIGVLHGILLLGLAGHTVLRMVSYSGRGYSRNRDKNSGQGIIVVLLIALGLIILGFIGTFFGNLIKAAVSRQREYLADASAVQFTRNPNGLAGALKKIGGFASGSKLKAANAAEASHMFFAKGVFEGFSGLWATHPPLEKRIRAIEPAWNGEFPEVEFAARSRSVAGVANFAGDLGNEAPQEVPVDIVDHAVDQVGEPTRAHQHYAAHLLRRLPKPILSSAREPYGSRAILFGLLLDRHDDEVRDAQLLVLQERAKPDIVRLTQKLIPLIDDLDARARLPVVDLAIPALRSMCESQYREFAKCFDALVRADQKIDLFEWMLSQVLMRHLRPQFEPVRSPRTSYYALQQLGGPISTLLSAVSFAGNSQEQAARAFQIAASHLPELKLTQQPRTASGLGELQDALTTLATVVAKQRGRLVDACAAAICADEHVRWQEAELLRGISDLLDCPMPPLLVRTQSASAQSVVTR